MTAFDEGRRWPQSNLDPIQVAAETFCGASAMSPVAADHGIWAELFATGPVQPFAQDRLDRP